MIIGKPKREIWSHSFAVGETRRHKGYTIYRITSIVFPRTLPEALTKITLWKRFSDVKKLCKELSRRHRERHLSGAVPLLKEKSYFKRFDPAVVEERKRYILELLKFAGQEPVLYRSHAFVSFFQRGISPDGSPEKLAEQGNIASIRESLAIPCQPELSLLDPSRDGSETSGGEDGDDNESFTSSEAQQTVANGSLVDSVISGSTLSDDDVTALISDYQPLPPKQEDRQPEVDSLSEVDGVTMDYIVEAAMVFSKAVEAEANGDFKEAFEQYKDGIGRLLNGAKDDVNAVRKKIAREKSFKYVTKAEQIYERYLLSKQNDNGILPLSPITPEDPSSPILLLERPLNYLSRYKVVQVIDSVMQVQDVTDKKFYIMKGIRKPSSGFSSAVFFPQQVPYMVPLVAYFQSDTSVFLLLKLVSAGKLWNYILSYRKPAKFTFQEEDEKEETENTDGVAGFNDTDEQANNPQEQDRASEDFAPGFADLLNEYTGDCEPPKSGELLWTDEVHEANECLEDDDLDLGEGATALVKESPEDHNLCIAPYELLSTDMDVSELVSCSQQLLRSVSHTLEQSEGPSKPRHTGALEWPVTDRENLEYSLPPTTSSTELEASQLELAEIVESINLCIEELKQEEPISIEDLLPEGSIRRWISELVVAVECLHFNGIVCGDLTMDNLLLGAEGQLMLTYFYRRDPQPTQTLASDVAPKQEAVLGLYVAPERPLQPKSDYWSIGVIMYELLTKRTFLSCHPAGVYCYHEVQYPEDVELSEDARALLEGLLQPEVDKRFDLQEIVSCSFFHGIDWRELRDRGQCSP